jgi:hypothetical protein
MINVRSFHDYLGGRFYDSRFYAPNDTTVYNAAAVHFNNPAEYVYTSSAVWSSYMMSVAAMWSPEVLRPATSGGYQAPTFATAFTRQNLAGAGFFAARDDQRQHNKIIAAQHGLHAPKKHGLATKGNELLGLCPSQPRPGACRHDDRTYHFGRKRLVIVHS